MSHKTARLSEAELKAKEVRIRRTYESIQQGYIDLAVDLDDARARGDFRPGTFAEWVKDNFPFSVREAHRLATNHAVVTVTRQLFHQTPKTPYAARTLAPFADDSDALRKIQDRLKAEGLSIGAAKVNDLKKAIKAAGLSGRRVKPGRKARP